LHEYRAEEYEQHHRNLHMQQQYQLQQRRECGESFDGESFDPTRLPPPWWGNASPHERFNHHEDEGAVRSYSKDEQLLQCMANEIPNPRPQNSDEYSPPCSSLHAAMIDEVHRNEIRHAQARVASIFF
jgi:hypothetical protein